MVWPVVVVNPVYDSYTLPPAHLMVLPVPFNVTVLTVLAVPVLLTIQEKVIQWEVKSADVGIEVTANVISPVGFVAIATLPVPDVPYTRLIVFPSALTTFSDWVFTLFSG